jgi:hypothetical protein
MVRPIPGSFPPDLELTTLGCQNRKVYLKTSSDASFHTFRLSFCRTWLARELGAGSGEQGKRERGAGIVVRNPKIDKFHQK